jgi:ketosteroid isomerase-like protein
MKNKLPACVGSLVVSLLVCTPSLSATAGADTSAAEAAVRQADSLWAAMAKTGSVDAWMTFYAPDAMVMPPGSPLLSDKEHIRQVVTQLLGQPHLSLSWHPVKVEAAASGDLAYLIGAYELHFDDAHGAPVADRGKILEIWRRQSDGSWRCSVDTWNSDQAAEAPAQAAAASAAQGMSAAVAAPVPAAAPPAAEPPATAQAPVHTPAGANSDEPVHYEDAIHQYFAEHLAEPGAIRYEEITKPVMGRITVITGPVLLSESHLSGWIVKATIDAKNRHGAYVNGATYTFLFRGEKIVHIDAPGH